MDIFNKKKIKDLEETINAVRNNRDYYEKLYISQVEHTNSLVKDNTYLKEENTKLMDWVFNILKEFGTCEVHERRVSIPVVKENFCAIGEEGKMRNRQVIHIPEIIIGREY